MSQVERSIAAAMDEPDDRRMFARVKSIVAHHLRGMDPSVNVTTTEFFNHTHVPDMVLRWPDRPQAAHRFVYLRTTSNQEELEDDSRKLPHDKRPVLLALQQFSPTQHGERTATARDATTLLLDAPALQSLQPPREPPGIPHLVSRSVLEGGRGALNRSSTERFLQTMTRGANGAREGQDEPTRAAVEAVSEQMTGEVADRMSSFLAALWQGGGATLATFPVAQRVVGQLDETALMYLLQSETIRDTAFWNRVVRLISLPVLLRTSVDAPENLQQLMREAVRQWPSRTCMVTTRATDRGSNAWRWRLESGQLILETPRFHLRTAQTRKSLPRQEGQSLPRLSEVQARADRFGLPLTSLGMVVTDRRIGYAGPGDDISRDSQLMNIGHALEGSESVLEAVTRVPAGALLECSFREGVASARGARTQVQLDALLRTTARLLTELTEEESEMLDELLGPEEAPSQQFWSQTSFDDL
ncbi:hypothetical protein SAMN06297387_10539 [Streptomyces zhaozhouensis]|uniref:Uncharacterized protein n=1 Tax=Streptomyces zhaozhouensis TaxID=1300267 RepID=A0A286DUI8_9ACTN|nr:hypothetical protein [Streptomyces zhaozhouensis]SOD62224.1 hypothetical protein SAMN06297387_10539 [Streptomyces zhaozhouensis]